MASASWSIHNARLGRAPLWQSVGTCAIGVLLVAIFFLRDGPVDADTTLFWLAGAIVVLALILRGPGRPALRQDWPYLGYLTVAMISILVSFTPHGWREFQRQLLFLAVIHATSRLAATPSARRVLMGTVVVSSAVVLGQAVYASLAYRGDDRLYVYESVIQWSGYPELGLLASLGTAAALAFLTLSNRRSLQVASGILASFFAIAALLVYSRSAWVTIAFVAVWLAVVGYVRWRKTVSIAMLAAILVLALMAARAAPLLSQYAGTFSTAAASQELQTRMAGWQLAMLMLSHRPFIGVGPGNYGSAHYLYQYSPDASHAYNIVLHTAAEVGLLGLAFYLAMWFRVLANSFRDASPGSAGTTALAVHAVLLAFFIRSQSEHFLANLGTSFRLLVFLGVLFGLAEGLWRSRRPGRM